MIAVSRRRTLVYGAATVLLGAIGTAGMLLAVDVYLHHRVQDLGSVNVWGYRGSTIGRKQRDEIRIVMLGGSTAFGYGLPSYESIPFFLERQLNARAPATGRYRVINLGAPGQGAFGFRFDLADYAYLRYDVAILYEGYNDLGMRDLPESVPPRNMVNELLWRRQSPVFRATGYLPVLPLVFREKAMALMAGGDLDAAYRGRATFKPGLGTRATAAALESAATIAEAVGQELGRLSPDREVSADRQKLDTETWRNYTTNVLAAVTYARQHGVKVLVVTQPYASDAHVAQQRAVAAALESSFGRDGAVRYVNLGPTISLRDHEWAYDGLHLVAKGNKLIADHLVQPVLDITR